MKFLFISHPPALTLNPFISGQQRKVQDSLISFYLVYEMRTKKKVSYLKISMEKKSIFLLRREEKNTKKITVCVVFQVKKSEKIKKKG